jgi:hypothetical protein
MGMAEIDAAAEARIEEAVEQALRGAARFDLLPPELEDIARQRWRERLAAGESAPNVVHFSGGWGTPL